MAVVLLVAVDFAAFGYLEGFERPLDAAIITVPMAATIVLTLVSVIDTTPLVVVSMLGGWFGGSAGEAARGKGR
jgi:hypothetical protein